MPTFDFDTERGRLLREAVDRVLHYETGTAPRRSELAEDWAAAPERRIEMSGFETVIDGSRFVVFAATAADAVAAVTAEVRRRDPQK